jgi:hypothetical protein
MIQTTDHEMIHVVWWRGVGGPFSGYGLVVGFVKQNNEFWLRVDHVIALPAH